MSGRVKGWCPSLLKPMRAADGWLARLKPPGARLTARAARAIAVASNHYGNGRLELTQRAGLQVRGLTDEGLQPLADVAIGHDLASPDPEVEAHRNVMVSPLAGDDPDLSPDCRELAMEIEAGLAARPLLASLPDKFGFLVDGGGRLPMTGVTTDVALRLHLNRIDLAGSVALPLPPLRKAASQALDIAEKFLVASEGHPRRLGDLLAWRGAAVLGLSDVRDLPEQQRDLRPAPGFLRYGGCRGGAVLAAWPFGALDARQLSTAADLASDMGDGTLRLTPWRALAFPGIAEDRAEAALARLAEMGALFDEKAPLLRIEACPGQGACSEASVDTRALATSIAPHLPDDIARLHVSGCAKGCAHRSAAPLTLVGEVGHWNVVMNGSANSIPEHKALNSKEILDLVCHA